MAGRSGGSRWTSFVADIPPSGRVSRGLHEEANARHRLRVEHDPKTLLIHLSDEDAAGWTTIAVDRETRRSRARTARTQSESAQLAYRALYRRAV
jgi:hypothetical protein